MIVMIGRSRVKICGITNVEDAFCAIEAGADALGFVFYEKSPRYVTPLAAAGIISRLSPFVTTVGLFVNASRSYIDAIVMETKLDLIQFHGDESEDFCRSFSRPYIKAVRVRTSEDVGNAMAAYPSALGILLDAYVEDVPGGTGEVFNWALIPEVFRSKIILAGGLNPENVAQAIKAIAPYAVDVSGGVEASKGKKNPMLINKFIKEVVRE